MQFRKKAQVSVVVTSKQVTAQPSVAYVSWSGLCERESRQAGRVAPAGTISPFSFERCSRLAFSHAENARFCCPLFLDCDNSEFPTNTQLSANCFHRVVEKLSVNGHCPYPKLEADFLRLLLSTPIA